MKPVVKCFQIAILSLAALTTTLSPAWADVTETRAVKATATAKLDERKLELAKHLTDRLQGYLQLNKVLVAVVCRKGGNDIKKHDLTGMAHTGLAVYDPRAQTWLLYNLMNNSTSGHPIANLWRTAPLDFFYGQTGYEDRALVLTPDKETQRRIYEAVLNGKAKKLLFTHNYNLLSLYDDSRSLNCSKWILMNLAAARIDDYEPAHVLQAIHDGFEPAHFRLSPLERIAIRRMKNVRAYELPASGPIYTVTPQSLYDSRLFEHEFML